MKNKPRNPDAVDWLIFISMAIVGLLDIFVNGSVFAGSVLLFLGSLGLSLLISMLWAKRKIDQLQTEPKPVSTAT